MSTLVRCCLCLALLVGLTVGLVYAQPAWIADLGLDFWSIPEMEKKLAQENQRRDDLEVQEKKLFGAITRKREILQDLVLEKMPLYQAAAEIQELTPPEYLAMAAMEMNLEDKSLEEQLFRVVISWAQKQQNGNPQETRALLNRLETELRQALPQ